jgi:hypothetical protein
MQQKWHYISVGLILSSTPESSELRKKKITEAWYLKYSPKILILLIWDMVGHSSVLVCIQGWESTLLVL